MADMNAGEAVHGITNISGDIIGNNLQTAQFLLKIGDRLNSTIKDYNDYALVQRWKFSMEHYIQGYVPGQVHPRRPTSGSPLEVFMLHGDYIPPLFQMVAKQEIIADDGTSLVILTSAGDYNQKIMELKLTSAAVESIDLSTQYYPFFRILIRYKKFEITCFNYKQDDFTNSGQKAFNYDFSINTTA